MGTAGEGSKPTTQRQTQDDTAQHSTTYPLGNLVIGSGYCYKLRNECLLSTRERRHSGRSKVVSGHNVPLIEVGPNVRCGRPRDGDNEGSVKAQADSEPEGRGGGDEQRGKVEARRLLGLRTVAVVWYGRESRSARRPLVVESEGRSGSLGHSGFWRGK